nr:hypothetical protein CFP56_28813 [Quercus suber]POE53596.1 hypothetical protein CFP56_28818 [Quercus suber]
MTWCKQQSAQQLQKQTSFVVWRPADSASWCSQTGRATTNACDKHVQTLVASAYKGHNPARGCIRNLVNLPGIKVPPMPSPSSVAEILEVLSGDRDADAQEDIDGRGQGRDRTLQGSRHRATQRETEGEGLARVKERSRATIADDRNPVPPGEV